MRGRADILLLFFLSLHLTARVIARSRDQIRKLSISHPILTSSPGTAALENCESSALRLAVLSRLQRSHLPSRTIQPCPAYAPDKRSSVPALAWLLQSTCVLALNYKRKYCTAVHISTAVIAHCFWAHIGSIPWATSSRRTSQLLLRREASLIARNIFTPLPYRL